jgi:hypothetical protein
MNPYIIYRDIYYTGTPYYIACDHAHLRAMPSQAFAEADAHLSSYTEAVWSG